MKRILLVDDDKLLLEGYALFCGLEYTVDTALSGAEALAKLQAGGPYAVIVTDSVMPVMSGTELLASVQRQWPDVVRIMLTGNREQGTAVRALNEGHVFRFMNKPCQLTELLQMVNDGVRQHELIMAEREVLEQTLTGSIEILTEILSVAGTSQMLRSQKLRARVSAVAKALKWDNAWEIEIAASLREIGAMTIPTEVVSKGRRGDALTVAEQQMLLRVPEIGSALLARVPRLQGVARIVLYQAKHFDGSGSPKDAVAGEAIPRGARLLKILFDWIVLEMKGTSTESIRKELGDRTGWYDPALLTAVAANDSASQPARPTASVMLKELRAGDRLAGNILNQQGVVLMSAGYVVTEALLERLHNFAASSGVAEPLLVDAERSRLVR